MRSLKNKACAPVEQGNLNDWLNYLESIHPTGIDLGLERVLIVLRRLFRNQPSARIITVAGTNGKGSTIACLEALLRGRGRTVGAYTSPHLHRYNERVRINGSDVDDGTLIQAFRQVEEARGSISLTYFEFGTLAAFLVLDQAGVDDWLLEIGLGGRLDAVNVLDPDLAIITSVDIDHVGFLGDNRDVIGFEKAGILRPGLTAICADEDPPSSVLQQAAAQKVRLLRPGQGYEITQSASGRALLIAGAAPLPLPDSELPLNSLCAALVAFHLLEPDGDLMAAAQSLASIHVPGRMEAVGRFPVVYIDVGHNPHAARWLAGQVEQKRIQGGKVRAVYAALEDKDVEGVVAAIRSVVDRWYLAGLDVPRGLPAEALAGRLDQVLSGLPECTLCSTVTAAIDECLADSDRNDLVIVFGSFFTAAEARMKLAGH